MQLELTVSPPPSLLGFPFLPPVHSHPRGDIHSARIYPKVVKTQDSGASLLGLGPTSELAIDRLTYASVSSSVRWV